MKTIRVKIDQQPELYQNLIYRLNTRTEYEGYYITLYSEYREYGVRIGTFELREIED